MTITALPTPPSTSDPVDFDANADAFLAALPTFVTQVNALVSLLNGALTGSSASSVAVATGSKSFTASTGMAWQIGQPLMIASASAPGDWMSGPVTAYNSATGALTVNVTSIGALATKTDWIISIVPVGFAAGQIPGSGTNDNANAGDVGEYVSSTVLSGSGIAVSASTPTNITSISLTPGDWDVSGVGWTIVGGSTMSFVEAWVSTLSATSPTRPNNGGDALMGGLSAASGNQLGLPTGAMRVSLASTTTVYLSMFANVGFTGYGFLSARRAR